MLATPAPRSDGVPQQQQQRHATLKAEHNACSNSIYSSVHVQLQRPHVPYFGCTTGGGVRLVALCILRIFVVLSRHGAGRSGVANGARVPHLHNRVGEVRQHVRPRPLDRDCGGGPGLSRELAVPTSGNIAYGARVSREA